MPLIGSIVLGGLSAAAIGIVFGLPSLRLRGFYLAVSTLRGAVLRAMGANEIQLVFERLRIRRDRCAGAFAGRVSFEGPVGRYLFALTIVAVLTFLAYRLVSSQTGRNFIAVRDNETAARIIGIPVLRTKLLAFAISSSSSALRGNLGLCIPANGGAGRL